MHGKCPSCGYCPCCGRRDAAPGYPYIQPYTQPWQPYQPSPWWIGGGSVTIKQNDTFIGDPPGSLQPISANFPAESIKVTY